MPTDNRRPTAKAAIVLAEAAATGRPIEPLTELFPGLTVEDAYAIQLTNIRERLASGAAVVGHKVGLTAQVMRDLLGVDEPDFGHLLDDMVVEDGATVAAARFLQPKVEVEIAFVLGSPLKGPGVTIDDVLAATEAVCASIEIVGSRIADWKISLVDTIADNASSAGLVLGSTRCRPADLDLAAVEATMRKNGAVVATGTGAAVMGHPAAAVAWLANKLSVHDGHLEAGHVVLPGSCTAAIDVRPGDRIDGEFTGLGMVSVVFS